MASPEERRRAKVLLKARPTEAQLADRLSEPVPSGIELYLAAEDLSDQDELSRLARRLNELRPHGGFVYVVEGPLRSLDGSFFDLSANTEANRECIRRVASLAEAIASEAILVHAIAPVPLDVSMNVDLHDRALHAALPLAEYLYNEARTRGLVPLLENIPPVARMREDAYMTTPIGMSAEDMLHFANKFPGLKLVLDLSHAGLYLNGLSMGSSSLEPPMDSLPSYLSALDGCSSMEAYVDAVEPFLFEAHVSNARGLLEEGLPYGDGDLDLDALAVRISSSARYLVTETIEPDPDHAKHMREAQSRMEGVLGRLVPGGER